MRPATTNFPAARPAKVVMMLAAWLGLSVGLAGCRPGASKQPLADTDPIFVVPAVARLADQELTREQAERLLELLDHPDAAIRLAAGETLQVRSGGQSFGYRFWAGDLEREASVAAWREWAARRYGTTTRPR